MFQWPKTSISRGSTALRGFSAALAPFATAPAAAMPALARDAGDVLQRPGEVAAAKERGISPKEVRENNGKYEKYW